MFYSKGERAKELKQFRTLSLLNVERKVCLAVLAKRVTTYLLRSTRSTKVPRTPAFNKDRTGREQRRSDCAVARPDKRIWKYSTQTRRPEFEKYHVPKSQRNDTTLFLPLSN